MGSPLKSFPISGTWSTHTYDRLKHRKELRMAMGGKITLITPSEFLAEFVPKPAGITKDASLSSILSALPKETNEYKMYHPLVNALNGATKLCPDFTFVATPTKGDKAAERNQAVDCGLYPSLHAPRSHINDEGEFVSPAVDWSRIALPIEVKSTPSKDPFDDNKPDGQPGAAEKKESLGQILSYAQFMLDHQHLTFLFMIVIIQEDARLLRIDRSGIFVTKKFNYKTSGDSLMDFLWRFARLSPELQGQDPTTERVDHASEYADTMRAKLETPTVPDDYVRILFETSLDKEWAWWLLKLKDERTQKDRRFLVGKPHFRCEGVSGRGTRGYVAMDADDPTAPFVYLKDSWRVVHDEIQKEGAVLQTLNAEKVSYVPTLLCHGDLGHKTTSEELWRKYHKKHKKDVPYPLKQHIHYRLVVQEVGKPLSEFKDGSQLVSALVCCLIAHAQAYKIGLIHRDISAGNILLYPHKAGEWKGMLNDWELAKDVNSNSPHARQPDRTGTWQFLSAGALTYPEKQIVVQDELESVVHVMIHMAIRFLPHNCDDNNVGRLLYYYFDDCQATDTGFGCGALKKTAMTTGRVKFQQQGKDIDLRFHWGSKSDARHPIDELLETLLGWFEAYYAVTDEGTGLPKNPETRDNAFYPSPALMSMVNEVDIDALFADEPQSEPSSASSISTAPKSKSRDRAADLELAAKLKNHRAMIVLFKESLEKQWPKKDKTADKRPENGYKPGDENDRTAVTTAATPAVKRVATDVEDLEPPSTPKHRRTDGSE